jgi:hypothetical protein
MIKVRASTRIRHSEPQMGTLSRTQPPTLGWGEIASEPGCPSSD